MAKITLLDGLPFISIRIEHQGIQAISNKIVLDTGSFQTIFKTDFLESAGIKPPLTAKLQQVSGIGGKEQVIEFEIDQIYIDQQHLTSFPILMGAMNYGWEIDGMIGVDFLQQIRAIIDFVDLEITYKAL